MNPTRTELAYDILMKLLEKDIYPLTISGTAFAMADEFLEEVKRHEAENELVFDECVHMQTSMFNEHGIAKCFDCGKAVNQNREIVEVQK